MRSLFYLLLFLFSFTSIAAEKTFEEKSEEAVQAGNRQDIAQSSHIVQSFVSVNETLSTLTQQVNKLTRDTSRYLSNRQIPLGNPFSGESSPSLKRKNLRRHSSSLSSRSTRSFSSGIPRSASYQSLGEVEASSLEEGEEMIKEGLVRKKSRHKRDWNERYLEVTTSRVRYYENPDKTGRVRELPREKLSLQRRTRSQDEEVFALRVGIFERWVFRATSAEDSRAWEESLEDTSKEGALRAAQEKKEAEEQRNLDEIKEKARKEHSLSVLQNKLNEIEQLEGKIEVLRAAIGRVKGTISHSLRRG